MTVTIQARHINVLLFTSGIGGSETIKSVMDGVSTEGVSINFSVDSIDEEKLKTLRGCHISIQDIVDGMIYCNKIKVPFSVTSIIWPINANDDFVAFSRFFKLHGAKKIRFHFGSLEGVVNDQMSHVLEENFLKIRNKLRMSGKVPAILVTKEEYERFGLNFYRPQCISSHKLHVFLEQDGIKAAACCGILAQEDVSVKLSGENVPW